MEPYGANGTLWGHMGPLEPYGANGTLWGHIGCNGALWGQRNVVGPYGVGANGTLWGHIGCNGALWGHTGSGPMEPYGAVWGHMGCNGALWGQRDVVGPYGGGVYPLQRRPSSAQRRPRGVSEADGDARRVLGPAPQPEGGRDGGRGSSQQHPTARGRHRP